MQIPKINSQKKTLVIVFTIAVIAIAVATIVIIFTWKPFETPTVNQPGGSVELTPPTKEEQQAANDQKAVIEQREEAIEKAEQQQGLKQVTPTITYADQNGLNAYVGGVFEDDGICTAKLTKGARSFEKTSASFKDATTTGCAPIDFTVSDFQEKGDWQLVVTYKSSSSQGSSNSMTITVK